MGLEEGRTITPEFTGQSFLYFVKEKGWGLEAGVVIDLS